jgi:hypothetical protein
VSSQIFGSGVKTLSKNNNVMNSNSFLSSRGMLIRDKKISFADNTLAQIRSNVQINQGILKNTSQKLSLNLKGSSLG